MESKISKLSCEDFCDALASKAPIPGGGGAAALMGALGAALCAMAGNLTVGKNRFAEVESDIRLMISRAEMLRIRFLELIDEDAELFEPLSKAYSMPKDDPNYSTVMRKVTLDASKAPLKMMKCSCRAIDLLEEMLEKCSRLMISDVGCGAVAAMAALEAAAMNVFINTMSLRGDREADQMEASAVAMLCDYKVKAQKISDTVMETLRRG